MKGEFIDVRSPQWIDALTSIGRHDVYHRPEYAELSTEDDADWPVAFLYEEGDSCFFLPLVIRQIPETVTGTNTSWRDATSPYGYPGPLFVVSDRDESMEFLYRSTEALVKELHQHHVVSCFVRFHPLIDLPTEPFVTTGGAVVQHGHTVSIDLTASEQEMWANIRSSHRREISKGHAHGLIVSMDEDWKHLDTFIELYNQNMQRLNASEHYFFPPSYYLDLRTALAHRLWLATVSHEGQVVSAGLFTEDHGIVQYHLSGTSAEALKDQPLKSMLNFVRLWAKDRGDHVLHLGGGLGGVEDSLFAFKAGFSKQRHAFNTWRLICDHAAYAQLSRNWELAHGRTLAGKEYFPLYRMP